TFFFVPGVPSEYRHLVGTFVIPKIGELAPVPRTHVAFGVLKAIGIPESHLEERVRSLVSAHPSVTFGYRTHGPENHLKLLAHGETPHHAQAALNAARLAARAAIGELCFGEDEQTLPAVVIDLLAARKQTLSLAESCTGGMISALLTDVSGAS